MGPNVACKCSWVFCFEANGCAGSFLFILAALVGFPISGAVISFVAVLRGKTTENLFENGPEASGASPEAPGVHGGFRRPPGGIWRLPRRPVSGKEHPMISIFDPPPPPLRSWRRKRTCNGRFSGGFWPLEDVSRIRDRQNTIRDAKPSLQGSCRDIWGPKL